mmetsp:Transcript_36118/g.87836  ORF Transcript_36118/g.87836 Transcript_36118/m.87836 type:complete len:89 (-) Transcript_36118:1014-1280(-)
MFTTLALCKSSVRCIHAADGRISAVASFEKTSTDLSVQRPPEASLQNRRKGCCTHAGVDSSGAPAPSPVAPAPSVPLCVCHDALMNSS